MAWWKSPLFKSVKVPFFFFQNNKPKANQVQSTFLLWFFTSNAWAPLQNNFIISILYSNYK